MLTVFQAAEAYHIGRNRLYKAIQSGELRAFRPNSKSYILKETDVEEWIEGYVYSPFQSVEERRSEK